MRFRTGPTLAELRIKIRMSAENTVSNHDVTLFAKLFRDADRIRSFNLEGQDSATL
jgi:hypothetical protein